MLRIVRFVQLTRTVSYVFCTETPITPEAQTGPEYSNWVLVRWAGHNHDISIQRRQPSRTDTTSTTSQIPIHVKTGQVWVQVQPDNELKNAAARPVQPHHPNPQQKPRCPLSHTEQIKISEQGSKKPKLNM